MARIGIVAGEASGDYLAAELIKSLKDSVPDLEIEGICGPLMQKAGCHTLFPMEKLAVMGFVEVMGRYTELLSIRRKLFQHFKTNPPDIFIGIDAPDFNLGLEQQLREQGIPTVHYVSPSVWAWRSYRVKKIARAVDLMLTLFPFEVDFYKQHKIPVHFVGHPLAEQIAMQPDKMEARERLGLSRQGKYIAIMPGSRQSELSRMVEPLLLTASWCLQREGKLEFISSVLTDEAKNFIQQKQTQLKLSELPLTVYNNKAHDVLAAADVVLLTSGTITLEAMLLKKPMVVCYKVNWLSHHIIRLLVHIKHAALPNILSGEKIVPEFLQHDCVPEKIGPAVMHWLQDEAATTELINKMSELHEQLRTGGGTEAARAIQAHFQLQ